LLDADQRILVHQHVLCVAADGGKCPERFACLRQAWCGVLGAGHNAAGTDIRMSAQALRTGAAEARQARHDMIADTYCGHIRANGLDDTRTFMSQDEGTIEWEAAQAIDHVQIAVADTGRDGPHQNFATQRLVHLHLFDSQRLMNLTKHGSGHFHDRRSLVTLRHTIAAVARKANLWGILPCASRHAHVRPTRARST
jgi:hypothetical protein